MWHCRSVAALGKKGEAQCFCLARCVVFVPGPLLALGCKDESRPREALQVGGATPTSAECPALARCFTYVHLILIQANSSQQRLWGRGREVLWQGWQ